MKVDVFVVLFITIFMFGMVNAESTESLGEIKAGNCLNISQGCASCSYVNISSIQYPNKTTAVSNVPMTYFGNGEWRYEFCDTDNLGTYNILGVGDINSVDDNFLFIFKATPSGQALEESDSGIYIILLIIFALSIVALVYGIVRNKETNMIYIFISLTYILSNIFLLILWKLSEFFLYLIPFFEVLFGALYKISNIGYMIFFPVLLFFMVTSHFNNKKENKLKQMGFSDEDVHRTMNRSKKR